MNLCLLGAWGGVPRPRLGLDDGDARLARGARLDAGGALLDGEVLLVDDELAERVVEEPAVAVVAAVRVLELARVLDDLADVRPV